MVVLYLAYDAGAPGPAGAAVRGEAVRLARLVAGSMPDQPEATGLLALLLLTESRQAARVAADGSLVVLADQDRRRWDPALVAEGQALVRECLRRDRPGPYQLQAAINAVHADAPSVEATDWPQVVALYDHLLDLAPTPVVALNRAIAVAEVDGAGAALGLVEGLPLDGYHLFHATRAEFLRRLGRADEAAAAYAHAATLAPTAPERALLTARARAGGAP
jgi:RNA polymerase sigma-70 factor (ECF subfamily)